MLELRYVEESREGLVRGWIRPVAGPGAIITLSGPLGSGKTSLAKVLCAQLGVVDEVRSPTYAYMTRYRADRGLTVYHFDLYRLSSVEEFVQMGLSCVLQDPSGVFIIEWPEVIDTLLSERPYAEHVHRFACKYVPESLDERILGVE